jgi:hypothetical protein
MSTGSPFEASVQGGQRIERAQTGIRALLSLLFIVVVRVAEAVLLVVVVFELGFALVTRRPPSPAVRAFALRVLDYAVEVVRYLTYNDDEPPFPFRDLPPAPPA